ncbi:MAG: N-acetylmuramic acid 6-phosphate etherase [Acidaminococcaceae bacterium]|nr:N-acetylmuramic acid 6-phosphate etherase [Acidaminococcaceae bacterium]
MIDLTKLTTEQQNPCTTAIDEASALEITKLINAEDQTVPKAVKKILPEIARAITVIAGHLSHGGRLFYIGSGTSGRLGILDAAECPPTYNTDPNLIQGIIAGGTPAIFRAQEGAEDSASAGAADLQDKTLTNLDVVVGLSASGRTPYVIGALQYAQSLGAYTIAVTCTENPETAKFSNLSLTAVTGPEVITGSTRMKAGTAQKLILNMLSTGSMILMGKVYGNLMVDLQCTNQKLEARARRILMEASGCDAETAEALLSQSHGEVKPAILMHLSGMDYETAVQKLKENHGNLKHALR